MGTWCFIQTKWASFCRRYFRLTVRYQNGIRNAWALFLGVQLTLSQQQIMSLRRTYDKRQCSIWLDSMRKYICATWRRWVDGIKCNCASLATLSKRWRCYSQIIGNDSLKSFFFYCFKLCFANNLTCPCTFQQRKWECARCRSVLAT